MINRYSLLLRVVGISLGMPWLHMCEAETAIPQEQLSGRMISESSSGWLPKSLADWKLPESVQIHGFASQTYMHTTGNNFFGHSTNMGSLDFTEMGINGSWRPLSNLQASMQVIYRRAGQTDNQDLRIDFGFLDYRFLSDADSQVGIRLGRVVNPYGFYNDTRDMPFTRPSILLPQSIYFDINRNFALSGDGAQVYGEHHGDIGDFILQMNGFYTRTDDPTLKADFSSLAGPGGGGGKLIGEPSWIARLTYERDHGKIRLAVTSAELNASYKPSGGTIDNGRFSFSPILFSAQYNAELWSLTSEYALRGVGLSGFSLPLPNNRLSYTGESFYVQGTYRFIEGWESYLRYDVAYEDVNDRNGKLSATVHSPAYRAFAKDITAGVRWDVTPSLMLRAEYHRINGTNWISPLENTNTENTKQHWDLFAVSASLRF